MVVENSLYKAHILEHYTNPLNWGVVEAAHFSSGVLNPSCGDSVSITGCVENGAVTKIAFTGAGCVISLAAASLVTEFCKTKTAHDVLCITAEDVVGLLGLSLGPVRIKCALLALQALQKGIIQCRVEN